MHGISLSNVSHGNCGDVNFSQSPADSRKIPATFCSLRAACCSPWKRIPVELASSRKRRPCNSRINNEAIDKEKKAHTCQSRCLSQNRYGKVRDKLIQPMRNSDPRVRIDFVYRFNSNFHSIFTLQITGCDLVGWIWCALGVTCLFSDAT